MKIITVSGTHSGIGKTTFIENLLKRQLKGYSCLKVTVAHKGAVCPLQRNCGACDKLDAEFCIVTDEKVLSQKGKDTYRFKKAGSKQVLWLKAQTKEGLRTGLKKSLSLFDKKAGLIIEGTSVLEYLNPDLAIFIIGSDLFWKDSAKKILAGGLLPKKAAFFAASDMPILHNGIMIRLLNGEKDAGKVKGLA